ncbi:MAG: hypothetical protein ACPHID_06470 [Thermoplasmatota archaeon]
MNRAIVGAALVALWILLLIAGAWLVRTTLLGLLVIIVAVLGFVLTVASSLPQSTLHARED